MGDEILYGTMYYDLLNYCKNVSIECDLRLKNIFQNSYPEYKNSFVDLGSISNNENILKNYDYVIYAGSLGKYFRKDINDFKKSKKLSAKYSYINDAKDELNKLNGKYNIGISWKSFKNRYSEEKSIYLDSLKNLLNTNDCNFINLQYGDIKKEVEEFNSKSRKSIFTFKNIDLFNDFDRIAGVLKNLDLFISVSNSTAHLAGSLGVKTLLIKPSNHALFHYWNQSGKTTPWYKSITLVERKEVLNEKKFIEKYLNI